jgi:AcrR family transcriptional regulator
VTSLQEGVAQQRRARSPRGQGEQLREEILAAAERILIQTNDQSALSIRAIAAAVGVTPPSIYLHFADRNDLVFEVCERHAEQLERTMEEAAEGIEDPWERIRRRGYAYLQWGLDNPEHYRILMMSRPDQTPDRFVDERLVDTAGLVPVAADLVAAEPAGLPEIVEMLAAASSTATRLAGTYRFALPRLWSRYAHHLSLTAATADGSSIRTLGMAMTDVGADWREGEVLLQGMLRQSELVSAASHVVAELEMRLAVEKH